MPVGTKVRQASLRRGGRLTEVLQITAKVNTQIHTLSGFEVITGLVSERRGIRQTKRKHR